MESNEIPNVLHYNAILEILFIIQKTLKIRNILLKNFANQ